MHSPHIDSIKTANKVFASESRKILPSTPDRKQATVTRLLNDIKHMPRDVEGKKAILIRIGKYLKKPAYRTLLVSGMIAGGYLVHGTGHIFKLAGDMRPKSSFEFFGMKAANVLEPLPLGISYTAVPDVMVLVAAIQASIGITFSSYMLKLLSIDIFRKKRSQRTGKHAKKNKRMH